MPKKQKLVDKIRNNKRNVSLQDFETLIEVYGYIDKGGKLIKESAVSKRATLQIYLELSIVSNNMKIGLDNTYNTYYGRY